MFENEVSTLSIDHLKVVNVYLHARFRNIYYDYYLVWIIKSPGFSSDNKSEGLYIVHVHIVQVIFIELQLSRSASLIRKRELRPTNGAIIV